MWYYGERIRIEPDWNVNINNDTTGKWRLNIRIEPDWNVN